MPRRPHPRVILTQQDLGERILVFGEKRGFLRYIGATHFESGEWCGVELDLPEGKNDGRIEGQDYFLQLALRQVGKEMPAELLFRHQKTNKEKLRTGTWSMGDGKRVIAFPDGKEVQEYYLYKKGSRFVLEDRWGLVDDNGSMFVLIRNKGKSRKRSFPIAFTFESDGDAHIVTNDAHARAIARSVRACERSRRSS